MFLKFFDNFKNKHGILSQIFAAGVTKLLPPDEIRRFDGTFPSILNPLLSFFSPHLSFLMPLSPSLSPCPSPIISPQLFARTYIPLNPHPSLLILFCPPPHLSSLIPLPPSLSPYHSRSYRLLNPHPLFISRHLSSLIPVPSPPLPSLFSPHLY
jgi:hypothetical protein